VSLDADTFIAANDEDNFLRFYRLSQPGGPVQIANLNLILAGKEKSPEMDIEGGTRLGQRTFWITSHGRKANGDLAPKRHQLFALELTGQNGKFAAKAVGRVYTNLIADLSRDPKFASFKLAQAAELAPKSPGGLNIEALAGTPEGGLLIGFRSPVPDGKALVVPLLNPNELLAGQSPQFGAPILLDLGGLGLRDIGSNGHGYYLVAGPDNGKADFRLFFWPGGNTAPQPIAGVTFPKITPEGICVRDVNGRTDLLLVSDDGNRKFDGTDCKDLPESQRQFCAYRISP
jgi:hypothetical protein